MRVAPEAGDDSCTLTETTDSAPNRFTIPIPKNALQTALRAILTDLDHREINVDGVMIYRYRDSLRSNIGHLVNHREASTKCVVLVSCREQRLYASFMNHIAATASARARVTGAPSWAEDPVESVRIPVKEMLERVLGFRFL